MKRILSGKNKDIAKRLNRKTVLKYYKKYGVRPSAKLLEVGTNTFIRWLDRYGIHRHGKRVLKQKWKTVLARRTVTKFTTGGYVCIRAPGKREEKEHRIVMRQVIGRKLTSKEFVHHIDGNKTNNIPGNLWLCNASTHKKAHASVNPIIYELVRQNKVTFNRDKGIYELINFKVEEFKKAKE